jgi:hypothetical protein
MPRPFCPRAYAHLRERYEAYPDPWWRAWLNETIDILERAGGREEAYAFMMAPFQIGVAPPPDPWLGFLRQLGARAREAEAHGHATD